MWTRWSHAVAVCVAAGFLVAAPLSHAQPRFDQNGVLFVHGLAGTGAQFESQKMRFTSNGYPEPWIAAIDYDSLFATEPRALVHERIDQMVADLKERTGRSKVDILAHALGTSVMQEYLNSSPARAANVGHYVNINGDEAEAPPGGVPTLAVWAGRGEPGRRIVGATNVTLPNQTHVQSATSPEAFVEYFKFFTGEEPAHDLVPQTGRITIAGRVLHFPVNRAAIGAALSVWEVDGATGQRKGSAPLASTTIGESGDWGPVEIVAGRHYEFETRRPGAPVHHHFYEPFVRSDHLIRLLESDVLSNGTERGPRHVAAVIIRYKELWGDQPGQNDLLSVDGTNVCLEHICPIRKELAALFFSDFLLDGQSDLSRPDVLFSEIPYITGVDIFAFAENPPTGRTTVAIRSRGAGPTRAVNMPNYVSTTDVSTVQLNDFDSVDTAAACLRPARIGFKLHRMRGTRIVRVDAYVGGKRVVRRAGTNIARVVLDGLPRDGRMTVRIVATHSTGTRVESTRTWNGCGKGRIRVRRIPRRR